MSPAGHFELADHEAAMGGGDGKTRPPSKSLKENEAAVPVEANRKLYCLALIDENSGHVIRQATADDLAQFGLNDLELGPKQQPEEPSSSKDSNKQATFMQFVQNGNAWCRSCGTQASPQWRRGPPDFDVLCNACGTRWRRTNQMPRETPLMSKAEASRAYAAAVAAEKQALAEKIAAQQAAAAEAAALAAAQKAGLVAA